VSQLPPGEVDAIADAVAESAMQSRLGHVPSATDDDNDYPTDEDEDEDDDDRDVYEVPVVAAAADAREPRREGPSDEEAAQMVAFWAKAFGGNIDLVTLSPSDPALAGQWTQEQAAEFFHLPSLSDVLRGIFRVSPLVPGPEHPRITAAGLLRSRLHIYANWVVLHPPKERVALVGGTLQLVPAGPSYGRTHRAILGAFRATWVRAPHALVLGTLEHLLGVGELRLTAPDNQLSFGHIRQTCVAITTLLQPNPLPPLFKRDAQGELQSDLLPLLQQVHRAVVNSVYAASSSALDRIRLC
jgi:hypothetical protein